MLNLGVSLFWIKKMEDWICQKMCKGLIHEYQHKGKKQEATIQLRKLEATNHQSQRNET